MHLHLLFNQGHLLGWSCQVQLQLTEGQSEAQWLDPHHGEADSWAYKVLL